MDGIIGTSSRVEQQLRCRAIAEEDVQFLNSREISRSKGLCAISRNLGTPTRCASDRPFSCITLSKLSFKHLLVCIGLLRVHSMLRCCICGEAMSSG
jgi:hypothetical protein